MQNLIAKSSLFNTVAKRDFLEFNTDQGLVYQRAAEFLRLDKTDVSRLAGVNKASVRYDRRIPQEVKDRLQEIANVCQLVAQVFHGDKEKTALWFQTPNPLLGNISPRDLIRFGRIHKLMEFILDAMEENRVGNDQKTKKNEKVLKTARAAI